MMPKFNFKDIYELLILSAIWGSSFLFLRLATPVFGPIFLIEMRVVSGLVVLFPMVLILGKFQELKSNWRMRPDARDGEDLVAIEDTVVHCTC